MAYNHGKEERKWRIWKEAEEKTMRDCGVDEDTIEKIRIYDREVFNSDRRFYQRLQETDTYLDTVAEKEWQVEVCSVSKLLDEIENMELYRELLTADRLTLQIVLLKMQGCSTKEIAKIVHLKPNAIYGRMNTLRKKLKKFF
ncbi:MAG: sigma-70 family RNA polymerase sigma factor [Lachnospiraceae bacterium]|nr:sigma-70 family RNA polymerase sigma factor [Lachnospiraceae bacterium]